MERRVRLEECPEARLSSKREAQTRHPREHKEVRTAVISPSFRTEDIEAIAGCLSPNRSTAWRGGGRPEEGPEARLSNKREVQTRHPREHKEERKAVISPSFSNENT